MDVTATTTNGHSYNSVWKTKPNFKKQFENDRVELFAELKDKKKKSDDDATNKEISSLKYFGIRDKITKILIEMNDITNDDHFVFLFCSMRISNDVHYYLLMHFIS
jgi:hypothetical protein